jgi:hypothetical protein
MSFVPENQGLGRINHLWHRAKSHDRNFGAAVVSFPDTLKRGINPSLDQYDTEFCTAFGEATSNGYEYGQQFSGEWQAQAEGKYLGSPIVNGADPYTSIEATSIYGSLHSVFSPFLLPLMSPEFIADYHNWDQSLESIAKTYCTRLIPYYIDGPYDTFDNIRNALYQAFLANEKGVVKAFGFWYQSWNQQAANLSLGGILQCPPINEQAISRHRYTIIDWKTVNGTPHLVCAMTQGSDFGDHGIVYMDRATINQVFADMSANGLGLYINRPAQDGFAAAIQYFKSIFYFLKARAAPYVH